MADNPKTKLKSIVGLTGFGDNRNMCSLGTSIAIDLKSFYASVECRARGLEPLTTNLVVADAARTEKTICLAVSPSLKAYGVGGRARLFEVVERVREVNAERATALRRTRLAPAINETRISLPFDGDRTGRDLDAYRPIPGAKFSRSSFDDTEVQVDPNVELDYLIARPRMATYLETSAEIYGVYLKHFAPEDIHVYSIDEVFIDASKYLMAAKMNAKELASAVVTDIYETTGITATAGVGTNLYLAKIAMDILAKHEEPDENGVRIAVLDEESYKRRLWAHEPITDFWRVGRGYATKLEAHGMTTMGDVARASLGGPSDRLNEDLLFQLFGKNAELLIDHAWGVEPVTMAEIKAYRPETNCKASGQVLQRPYSTIDARLVVWEMADQLALDLVSEGLQTDKITLTIGYDRESLADPAVKDAYQGEITTDRYGRRIPKHAHGTENLTNCTSSSHAIAEAALALYDRIIDDALLVRKVTIGAERVVSDEEAERLRSLEQPSLFTEDELNAGDEPATTEISQERERAIQQTMLDVREKFGKNAMLRAANLQDGATARQRNQQIGGHRA